MKPFFHVALPAELGRLDHLPMEPSESSGPSQASLMNDGAELQAPVYSATSTDNCPPKETKITVTPADSSYASSSLDDGDCVMNAKVLAQLDSFSLAKSKLNASLDEANGSVPYPSMNAPFWKKLCAFSGLGLMVSVGYFDPGEGSVYTVRIVEQIRPWTPTWCSIPQLWYYHAFL